MVDVFHLWLSLHPVKASGLIQSHLSLFATIPWATQKPVSWACVLKASCAPELLGNLFPEPVSRSVLCSLLVVSTFGSYIFYPFLFKLCTKWEIGSSLAPLCVDIWFPQHRLVKSLSSPIWSFPCHCQESAGSALPAYFWTRRCPLGTSSCASAKLVLLLRLSAVIWL